MLGLADDALGAAEVDELTERVIRVMSRLWGRNFGETCTAIVAITARRWLEELGLPEDATTRAIADAAERWSRDHAN